MRVIKTTQPISQIQEELDLTIHPNSSYALIENGAIGVENCINVYFDPTDLKSAKKRLIEAGYYQNDTIEHLVGKINDEMHVIPLQDVLYIEGINNDTYVHTLHESYLIKDKLYELEKSLTSKTFVRISKSYIVSLYKIEKIKPTFQGKLVLFLQGHTKLEVSRHYVPQFKQTLGM